MTVNPNFIPNQTSVVSGGAQLNDPSLASTWASRTRGGYANDRLAYPGTLETDGDEHTHFMVFRIYSTIDPMMKDADGNIIGPDTMSNATDYERVLKAYTYGGAATGFLAGSVGSKYLNQSMAQSKTGWIKNPIIRTAVNAILITGSTWGASEIGDWLVSDKAEPFLKDYETVQAAREQIETAYRANASAEMKNTGRLMRFGEAMDEQKESIALYMPQKIQSLSLLEYESQDMSFMQNLLNDQQGTAMTAIIKTLPKVVDSVAGFLGLNTNFDSYLMAQARIAPNPRKQLMFREPISRKFEFQFNFSPRNAGDSQAAKDIITMFKKHAYPAINKSYSYGAFYTFPAEWEISYHSVNEQGVAVENDWLNKIGRCALREINVDYASSGSFSTFENGAPTNMVLSLTFEEMALLDSNLVERGY